MKKIIIPVLAVAIVLAAAALTFVMQTQAFNGPSSAPPGGNGAIGVNASNSVSFGTSTPLGTSQVLIVATNTANTNYSLFVEQPAGTPILTVRNDGTVSIATSTSSSTLTVAGNIYATGNVQCGGACGGSVSSVAAGAITTGVFNGNLSTTTGFFAFPSSTGIGTSSQIGLPATLSVYGTSQFTATSTFLGTMIIGSTSLSGGAPFGIPGYLVFNNPNGNTGVGYQGLLADTTGGANTAFGYQALPANTQGTSNTAIGYQAMYVNLTGNLNVAVGDQTLYTATSALQNTAIGNAALSATVAGNNTAVGAFALTKNTIGTGNVAVGVFALATTTSGGASTAVGYSAGVGQTSGTDDTYIGYGSGASNLSGNGNVFLGYNSGLNELGSNLLYIADGSASSSDLIYGNFSTAQIGIGTTTFSGTLNVGGGISGTALTITGSSTFKNNVTATGTVPTSLTNCGTGSGAISGSNSAGVLTMGTGGTVSACTLNFSTNFINPPICVVSPVTATSTLIVTSTISAMTISKISPTPAASSKFNYICIGN